MHLISATFFILFRYFHRYLLEFSSLIISFHFHLVENLYFFKLKCNTKLSKSFFFKKESSKINLNIFFQYLEMRFDRRVRIFGSVLFAVMNICKFFFCENRSVQVQG